MTVAQSEARQCNVSISYRVPCKYFGTREVVEGPLTHDAADRRVLTLMQDITGNVLVNTIEVREKETRWPTGS